MGAVLDRVSQTSQACFLIGVSVHAHQALFICAGAPGTAGKNGRCCGSRQATRYVAPLNGSPFIVALAGNHGAGGDSCRQATPAAAAVSW